MEQQYTSIQIITSTSKNFGSGQGPWLLVNHGGQGFWCKAGFEFLFIAHFLSRDSSPVSEIFDEAVVSLTSLLHVFGPLFVLVVTPSAV